MKFFLWLPLFCMNFFQHFPLHESPPPPISFLVVRPEREIFGVPDVVGDKLAKVVT